jgi:KDO2-lipid IV(A) lauroyltransferase
MTASRETTTAARRKPRRKRSSEPRSRPIVAWLVIRAMRVLGAMPLTAAHAFGRVAGTLLAILPTRERRVTAVNLRVAFPDVGARARRRIGRRSLLETGMTFAEIGAMWTWDRARIDGVVREVLGEEHLRGPMTSGRGVIVAGIHLGAWELIGMYCSARWPMTTLYREPLVVELDAFFREARGRAGARLVSASMAAARPLLRALRGGEMVGMLPDQDSGEGAGVFVPFFGVVANTVTLLSRLASRSGAAVVFAYAERLPRSAGFRLHFVPASEAVYDADVAVSATAMNQDIERLVRRLPEQYLWSYKRFRIVPRGAKSPYGSR